MSREKQIEELREFSNKKLLSIYGECLEGIGIRNPRKAVRDKSLKPQVGDIVHCHRDINFIDSYIKQVKSYDPDTEQFTVGTCYTDPSRDFTFVPEKIYGVITEIYDGDGFLLYERKGYRKQIEGEWLTDRFGMDRSVCSVCGAVFEGDGGNYCRKCGAKMKGAEG